MKVQINPLSYISASLFVGGLISYFVFAKPLESDISVKTKNLNESTLQLVSLQKDNLSLKEDISDYVQKVDSLKNVSSVYKSDLYSSLFAFDYFYHFNRSWLSSVSNKDFNQAKNLEDFGLFSAELVQDLRIEYGADTAFNELYSFKERLKPYFSKEN